MGKKKLSFSYEYLYNEYVVLDKTAAQMSAEHCVAKATMLRYLRASGFQIKKISLKGRQQKSKTMSENRTNGTIESWIKGKSRWELHPESVIKMKQTLKGRVTCPENSFKKGTVHGLIVRKNLIHRHHIDLEKINNRPSNLLYLISAAHGSLHKKAYNYLVETNQITTYINWFIQKFAPKLYTQGEYENINKEVTNKEREFEKLL